MTAEKHARNQQLDQLRGIAILLVMGVHFNFHAPQTSLAWYLEHLWRRIGLVGVDLFFVLSGFLIGSLLLTELEKHSKLDVPRFLIRRGFKLYPVYYMFLLYTLFRFAVKAGSSRGPAASLREGFSQFATSFVFLQNYLPPNPAAHTWSLAVEEHFYLMLPFLIASLGRARIRRWLIPVCLATIPICLALRMGKVWRQQATLVISEGTQIDLGASHLHFDGLLLGVALATLAIKFPSRFVDICRYRRTLVALGLILWVVALLPQHWVFFWGTVGFTLRILGSAAFLLGVCGLPSSGRRSVLAWVGASSYAIYVWHVTVMGITERLLGSLMFGETPQDGGMLWLVRALIVTASCVFAGAIVTRVVEKPSLALRDRWFPSRGRAITVPQGGTIVVAAEAVAT